VSTKRQLSLNAVQRRPLDRRVRRTRRLLQTSLAALLTTGPYGEITIQDITDRADLNRATFYLHYGSKDELLFALLQAQFDALVADLEEAWRDRPFGVDRQPLRRVLAYVAAEAPFYQALLHQPQLGFVTRSVIDYIAGVVERQLAQQAQPLGPPLTPPLPVLAHHVAGATFALIVWWIDNEQPYSPAEMADMIVSLALRGLQGQVPPDTVGKG
jgi:AcrR family transcriptional regulator